MVVVKTTGQGQGAEHALGIPRCLPGDRASLFVNRAPSCRDCRRSPLVADHCQLSGASGQAASTARPQRWAGEATCCTQNNSTAQHAQALDQDQRRGQKMREGRGGVPAGSGRVVMAGREDAGRRWMSRQPCTTRERGAQRFGVTYLDTHQRGDFPLAHAARPLAPGRDVSHESATRRESPVNRRESPVNRRESLRLGPRRRN